MMTIQDLAEWIRDRDVFVHVQVANLPGGPFIVDVSGRVQMRYTAPDLEEALRLAMHDVDARLLKEKRR